MNIVGFVKISSYCGFPQCGHSFAFFAFSSICSGIRLRDSTVYDALFFLNLDITGNTLIGLDDVLPLSENSNEDENEGNLESGQTHGTQRYVPLNLSGIYDMMQILKKGNGIL